MEYKHGTFDTTHSARHTLTQWENKICEAQRMHDLNMCVKGKSMEMESITKVNWIMQFRHVNDPVTGTHLAIKWKKDWCPLKWVLCFRFLSNFYNKTARATMEEASTSYRTKNHFNSCFCRKDSRVFIVFSIGKFMVFAWKLKQSSEFYFNIPCSIAHA